MSDTDPPPVQEADPTQEELPLDGRQPKEVEPFDPGRRKEIWQLALSKKLIASTALVVLAAVLRKGATLAIDFLGADDWVMQTVRFMLDVGLLGTVTLAVLFDLMYFFYRRAPLRRRER